MMARMQPTKGPDMEETFYQNLKKLQERMDRTPIPPNKLTEKISRIQEKSE